MSQLNAAQVADAAAAVANHIFSGTARMMGGTAIATAAVNWTDLKNAVTAIDAALDTTLATAATQQPSTDTIMQYLAAQIPSPVSGGTAQQKTILACYTLLKRAGLI